MISKDFYNPPPVIPDKLKKKPDLLLICQFNAVEVTSATADLTWMSFPDSKYGFPVQPCSKKTEVSFWVTQWTQKRKSEFIAFMPLYVCLIV